MAEHTPEPIPTPREDAPISLRSDTYPPVTPPRNGGGSQTLTLILTAAVFLLAGLLLATLLSGGDEAMTRADIDALVDQSVGTQVAALGLMPGDPDEARASLQEMVNSAVATQVSGSAPVAPSGGDNESLTRADIAALVDQSVGTQVAALVPTNTPIPGSDRRHGGRRRLPRAARCAGHNCRVFRLPVWLLRPVLRADVAADSGEISRPGALRLPRLPDLRG